MALKIPVRSIQCINCESQYEFQFANWNSICVYSRRERNKQVKDRNMFSNPQHKRQSWVACEKIYIHHIVLFWLLPANNVWSLITVFPKNFRIPNISASPDWREKRSSRKTNYRIPNWPLKRQSSVAWEKIVSQKKKIPIPNKSVSLEWFEKREQKAWKNQNKFSNPHHMC